MTGPRGCLVPRAQGMNTKLDVPTEKEYTFSHLPVGDCPTLTPTPTPRTQERVILVG